MEILTVTQRADRAIGGVLVSFSGWVKLPMRRVAHPNE